MRIGIDGRVLCDRYPGIGRATSTLLLALAAESRADLVVFHVPGETAHPLETLVAAGIELAVAPAGLRSLAEHVRLPGMARRLHLDVVHSPYLATAWRWPCPWVVSVHDVIPLRFPGELGPLTRRAYRLVLAQAVRRATLVIAPSLASARDLEKLVGGDRGQKLRVVANAVDPRFRPAQSRQVEAVRRALGIDGAYVLAHASERPHKNRRRLLEAWQRLGRRELLVVFGGDRAARTGDGVRELGWVADDHLPALYTGAELFVLPSQWEGFGLTAAEAMACGTAVACASGSALDEVAGAAAVRFDPSDAGSIAAAVAALLDDASRRRDLERQGLEQAQLLTPQRAARAALAVYREAVATARI